MTVVLTRRRDFGNSSFGAIETGLAIWLGLKGTAPPLRVNHGGGEILENDGGGRSHPVHVAGPDFAAAAARVAMLQPDLAS